MAVNCILKKIIKKFKLLYVNVIFGGLFGLFRGIILVYFLLLSISKCSKTIYLSLLNKSYLINLFVSITLNHKF